MSNQRKIRANSHRMVLATYPLDIPVSSDHGKPTRCSTLGAELTSFMVVTIVVDEWISIKKRDEKGAQVGLRVDARLRERITCPSQ